MKSIIVSIHPKWVEKIAIGKKTIEVRKTVPKETPFKAYIYCTKDKSAILRFGKNVCNGKVIGEFICDFVEKLIFCKPKNNCPHIPYLENVKLYNKGYFSCLSTKELCDYLVDKDGYAWHISDLKIYDKPKELGEFINIQSDKDIRCKYLSQRFVNLLTGKFYYKCALQHCTCEYYSRLARQTDCIGYEKSKIQQPLTRSPQSWCYVEELNGNNII